MDFVRRRVWDLLYTAIATEHMISKAQGMLRMGSLCLKIIKNFKTAMAEP